MKYLLLILLIMAILYLITGIVTTFVDHRGRINSVQEFERKFVSIGIDMMTKEMVKYNSHHLYDELTPETVYEISVKLKEDL